jgi:hypothetical protein
MRILIRHPRPYGVKSSLDTRARCYQSPFGKELAVSRRTFRRWNSRFQGSHPQEVAVRGLKL